MRPARRPQARGDAAASRAGSSIRPCSARPSRGVPQARRAAARAQPGHHRRRGHGRPRDGPDRAQPRRPGSRGLEGDGRTRLPGPDRGLAVVHGPVRHVRRGRGRGARQGPGSDPAQDAVGDRSPIAGRPTERSRRSARPSCARATSSSSATARSSPATATSSRASATSTRPRSLANRRPVLKEPGTDIRARVTGGTTVVSDELVVRITRRSGRDVPRSDDRAGRGRQAPADAERDRALDPAVRADRSCSCWPSSRCGRSARSPARTVGDRRARRAARLSHPDDDRRPAVGDRDRRAWTASRGSTCSR